MANYLNDSAIFFIQEEFQVDQVGKKIVSRTYIASISFTTLTLRRKQYL